MVKKIYISFLFVLITAFTYAEELVIPELAGKAIMDQTNTLSEYELETLNTRLTSFSNEQGSQIAVLIVPTTGEETIEQYGIRVAEKWQIGRKDIDDGVILIIAKNDRKLRVEVGYGLEGAIPDIFAKRIIENVIAPQFRSGQFYNGIYLGVDAIIRLINKENLPGVTSEKTSLKNIHPILIFLLIIIACIIFRVLFKKKAVKGLIGILFGVFIAYYMSSSLGTFETIVSGLVGLLVTVTIMNVDMNSKTSGGGGNYSSSDSSSGSSSSSGGGFSGGGGSFGGGGASGGW